MPPSLLCVCVLRRAHELTAKELQVFIDGSEIGEVPTEIVYLWSQQIGAGAYGPPVAELSVVGYGLDLVRCSADLRHAATGGNLS